jgi:hypothetical protein
VGEAKPFNIPKRVVWKAFKRVKANRGAAGVDKQSIAGFEADLSNNLYKLWNRMCPAIIGNRFMDSTGRPSAPMCIGASVPTLGKRFMTAKLSRRPRLDVTGSHR